MKRLLTILLIFALGLQPALEGIASFLYYFI